MIEAQDAAGLLFRRKEEVASIVVDFDNRRRLVFSDGSVAHRPSPPPVGPWVPLGDALVNPAHLKRTPVGWQDPADFLFPAQELAVPEPAAELPEVPQLPCRRDQVLGLKTYRKLHSQFFTDEGEFVWANINPLQASALLPELLYIRPGFYLNRRRLRRIRVDNLKFYLVLDTGAEHRTSRENKQLNARLGLTNFVHLEPRRPELYGHYQLRDWPTDLSQAPAEFLRKHFTDPRQLVGHLIWQRFRYRQLGIVKEWANSYRGFWYDELVHVLYRAGFLHDDALGWEAPDNPEETAPPSSGAELYRLLFQVMDYFVESARFFTFLEFGFVEPRPDCRRIGATHPEVILVAEKESFHPYALRLAEETGVSVRLLNSQPNLLGSEFFARALIPIVTRPVRIIAYVDYDPGGWIIGYALAKQLEFFGLKVSSVEFLIRQECFSAEEKRLYAHPCSMSGAHNITKTKNWVKESGGIDGKPCGIHANHVQPYERIRGLFDKLIQP